MIQYILCKYYIVLLSIYHYITLSNLTRSTMTYYTIEEVNKLYEAFDKTRILTPEYIKIFNTIRIKNKFNPHKFSKNNINFNNWKKSLSKEEEGKRNEHDIIFDKIRNLFNKCTNSNYEPLRDKLTEYIADSETMLNDTINIIFSVATQQSVYCQVYAKMCKHLYETYGETVKEQILRKCKEQFRNHRKLEACDEEDEYDLFCRVMKQKKKFVGMFNLVSNLYEIDMVDNVVIEKFITLLLSELKTNLNEDTKNEYVECLKTIFTNVYKKLMNSFEKDKMTEYHNDIKNMSSSSNFKNRDKFKFMDILELFE